MSSFNNTIKKEMDLGREDGCSNLVGESIVTPPDSWASTNGDIAMMSDVQTEVQSMNGGAQSSTKEGNSLMHLGITNGCNKATKKMNESETYVRFRYNESPVVITCPRNNLKPDPDPNKISKPSRAAIKSCMELADYSFKHSHEDSFVESNFICLIGQEGIPVSIYRPILAEYSKVLREALTDRTATYILLKDFPTKIIRLMVEILTKGEIFTSDKNAVTVMWELMDSLKIGKSNGEGYYVHNVDFEGTIKQENEDGAEITAHSGIDQTPTSEIPEEPVKVGEANAPAKMWMAEEILDPIQRKLARNATSLFPSIRCSVVSVSDPENPNTVKHMRMSVKEPKKVRTLNPAYEFINGEKLEKERKKENEKVISKLLAKSMEDAKIINLEPEEDNEEKLTVRKIVKKEGTKDNNINLSIPLVDITDTDDDEDIICITKILKKEQSVDQNEKLSTLPVVETAPADAEDEVSEEVKVPDVDGKEKHPSLPVVTTAPINMQRLSGNIEMEIANANENVESPPLPVMATVPINAQEIPQNMEMSNVNEKKESASPPAVVTPPINADETPGMLETLDVPEKEKSRPIVATAPMDVPMQTEEKAEGQPKALGMESSRVMLRATPVSAILNGYVIKNNTGVNRNLSLRSFLALPLSLANISTISAAECVPTSNVDNNSHSLNKELEKTATFTGGHIPPNFETRTGITMAQSAAPEKTNNMVIGMPSLHPVDENLEGSVADQADSNSTMEFPKLEKFDDSRNEAKVLSSASEPCIQQAKAVAVIPKSKVDGLISAVANSLHPSPSRIAYNDDEQQPCSSKIKREVEASTRKRRPLSQQTQPPKKSKHTNEATGMEKIALQKPKPRQQKFVSVKGPICLGSHRKPVPKGKVVHVYVDDPVVKKRAPTSRFRTVRNDLVNLNVATLPTNVNSEVNESSGSSNVRMVGRRGRRGVSARRGRGAGGGGTNSTDGLVTPGVNNESGRRRRGSTNGRDGGQNPPTEALANTEPENDISLRVTRTTRTRGLKRSENSSQT